MIIHTVMTFLLFLLHLSLPKQTATAKDPGLVQTLSTIDVDVMTVVPWHRSWISMYISWEPCTNQFGVPSCFSRMFVIHPFHPQKFNNSPLKMDGWKTILCFWACNFSGSSRLNFEVLVLFPLFFPDHRSLDKISALIFHSQFLFEPQWKS